MERIILQKNGTKGNGKVVSLTRSFERLLAVASSKFGIEVKRIFNIDGAEIDDANCLRDEDVLFVSRGESFIAPSHVLTPKSSEMLGSGDLPEWITLNVGGRYFSTTRNTLVTKEPNSMLARMFATESGSFLQPSAVDKQGAFLIDRSPVYFEPILNYLRHGQLIIDKNVNPEGVLEEARFFGVDSVISDLEALIQDEKCSDGDTPLTRSDIVRSLISTTCASELRFQGVNLAKADLSRLDLRHINFKYANLHGSKLTGTNLSYCCLERADLSNAHLEGAVLLGVKMLCANLEGSNLRSCNMEDPAGTKANLEGVNLKGANIEGSQMAGVNLRVATLKNANLQNCDLRGAVLAGADLENCDLSGSDLHEANLRGANLKNTAFELMLTPLHMSQAIR